MEWYGFVIGMMVVTYLPRLLPFVAVQPAKLSPRTKRFLELIPYCGLGALILPDAFLALNNPLIAGAGLLFAGLYGYYKGGIIIPVVGAMATVYLLLGIG